jgi:hypothetical protein
MHDEGGLRQSAPGDVMKNFVSGIYTSISAAKHTMSTLQTVYQVNTTHMNFSKYELYNCHGITSYSPVNIGIVLGNEDKC